jgi:hypothetical protein
VLGLRFSGGVARGRSAATRRLMTCGFLVGDTRIELVTSSVSIRPPGPGPAAISALTCADGFAVVRQSPAEWAPVVTQFVTQAASRRRCPAVSSAAQREPYVRDVGHRLRRLHLVVIFRCPVAATARWGAPLAAVAEPPANFASTLVPCPSLGQRACIACGCGRPPHLRRTGRGGGGQLAPRDSSSFHQGSGA